MAAHAGVVAVLYYALSPRGLGSTGDLRKEARDEGELLGYLEHLVRTVIPGALVHLDPLSLIEFE